MIKNIRHNRNISKCSITPFFLTQSIFDENVRNFGRQWNLTNEKDLKKLEFEKNEFWQRNSWKMTLLIFDYLTAKVIF